MKLVVQFMGVVFEKLSTSQLFPLDEASGVQGESRLLLGTQLAPSQ